MPPLLRSSTENQPNQLYTLDYNDGGDIMQKIGGGNMTIPIMDAERELTDLLNKKRLCVFVGSGVSVSAPNKFNEYHAAIVNTNYSQILTTNYDTFLDEAAKHYKHIELCKRIYTYEDADKISSAIYGRDSSLIHVHGIRMKIPSKEFILTKDDYKRIKDKNPGFRIIMNTLFMNYSMLLVGYDGSDPHMEDIIEDINLSLGWLDTEFEIGLPTYYIVLHQDKVSPIIDHIKNRNRTKIIRVESYSDSLELIKRLAQKHPRTAR